MAAKLTKAQRDRLIKKAYFECPKDCLAPCAECLDRAGTVTWKQHDAGRTALSQHQGGTDGR